MSQMPTIETTKHSINLRDGDYAAIQAHVKDKPIHASDVIRELISKYVDNVIGQPKIDPAKLTQIDIGDIK